MITQTDLFDNMHYNVTRYNMKPVTPGEILLEEYLKPLGLSQNAVGRALGVSPRSVNEIVLGKRALTADTAVRLGKYFNMTPQFWLGLQMDFEIDVATDRLGEVLATEVSVRPGSGV